MRRLYRMFLALWLPRTLRDAHGVEMEALFAEELKLARVGGRLDVFRAAFAGFADVARRAPREHWLRSGPVHSQNKEHPVQSLLIDLRHSFRAFARQPAATALIVATLALAVAANTVVFTLLDSVFMRPFPFPESSRLVYLNERAPTWNLDYTSINFPDFVAWRDNAKAFESIALFETESVNLAGSGGAERVRGMRVTHDLADVLKIRMVLGRMFSASEDIPNGPLVVIIGYGLWQSRFGGDPNVVGKTLRVNSASYTVIGVMPSEAGFLDNAAVWLPLGGDPKQNFGNYSSEGIGRLKAGVSLVQAERSLFDAHSPIWAARDTAKTVSPRVEPLRARMVASYVTAGKALGIAALLVLLVASANIGGTMLARSIARRREVAIRVALGASASRVVRQLLTESMVFSTVAGVVGTVAANIFLVLLVHSGTGVLPRWAQPSVNAMAVAFAVGIVAVATLLFGLAPALHLRRHVAAGAGVGGERAAGSVPERRMLSALVVIEVALASVLLVSGGLLLRAYDAVRHVDPGFRSDGVVTFQVALPTATYPNGTAQFVLYKRLEDRLRGIPGVDHVGGVNCLPLTCDVGNFFRAEGTAPNAKGTVDPVTLVRIASPDYFAAMGISLSSGHVFRDGEGGAGHSQRVAVINKELAHQLWPNGDPVGKRFANGHNNSDNWITVVGVVTDVRHHGVARAMVPGLYLSPTSIDSTDDWRSFGFAVHGRGDVAELITSVRTAAREIDPELPLIDVRSLQATLDASMSQQRLISFSLSLFAFVALALAMGGIHAVLSYVVGRRRREIAIRMAVGAQRKQVLRMVLRQGLVLTGIGIAIGIPLAVASSKAMRSLLVGITELDPLTYIGAIVILTLVGAIGGAVPALRAARMEPKSVMAENG